MRTMTKTIEFKVDGLPPAKSEAQSMLGPRHPHAGRVQALLTAAGAARAAEGGVHFGPVRLGMEVVMTLDSGHPSDVTNYLGGIADVLEEKGHRMALDHLGELAHFALYDNDRQLDGVSFRQQAGGHTGYTVRLYEL